MTVKDSKITGAERDAILTLEEDHFSDLKAVGGEFVGIRHRSIFGSREPGVPREVVAMA